MKVLIVKLSAFGDIVHALPALHDLLARPEVVEVHWLLDARYAFVAEIFPPQVRVHQVDLRGSRPLRSVWQSVRNLRRKHFDVLLDLQGLIKSALIARLIHPRVYGMDECHLRERFSRHLLDTVPFRIAEQHVVQQYRRVAAAPFNDVPGDIPYSDPQTALSANMLQAGKTWLNQNKQTETPYVWLHLGGGWATKQLPQATWQSLAEGLIAEGIMPILGWGNKEEKKAAERVWKACPDAFFSGTRLSMHALCGVLARATAVVGPDTGVVHLAAALGTPTVSFWGPSASWRSAPLAPIHRHIESSPACGPCFKRTCSAFICMDMVNANDILAAIHDVLPAH